MLSPDQCTSSPRVTTPLAGPSGAQNRRSPNPQEQWLSYVHVETTAPDEEVKREELSELVRRIIERNFNRHSHALRGSHVKSLAFLRGALVVSKSLPAHLRHGLFTQTGRTYRVAARLSSEASQIEDDKIHGTRGLGLKIFDVVGPGIAGQPVHTQDMLFNSLPVSEFKDIDTALEIWSARERHWDDSEAFRKEMSRRPDASLQTGPARQPNVHLASLTLYSQTAFRFGPWVCKFSLVPSSRAQLALREARPLPSSADFTAHRKLLRAYCHSYNLSYTLRAQFCSDCEQQPVEDVSIEWKEEDAPWLELGELVFPVQESYSDAMRVWWEDHIALCPWQGLEDHRPLGSLNRARKLSYARSRDERARRNCVDVNYPTSFDEVPFD